MADKVKIRHRFSGVRAAIASKQLDKSQVKELMAAINENPKLDVITSLEEAGVIKNNPSNYFKKVVGNEMTKANLEDNDSKKTVSEKDDNKNKPTNPSKDKHKGKK